MFSFITILCQGSLSSVFPSTMLICCYSVQFSGLCFQFSSSFVVHVRFPRSELIYMNCFGTNRRLIPTHLYTIFVSRKSRSGISVEFIDLVKGKVPQMLLYLFTRFVVIQLFFVASPTYLLIASRITICFIICSLD